MRFWDQTTITVAVLLIFGVLAMIVFSGVMQ
jgi:hypothetical protein